MTTHQNAILTSDGESKAPDTAKTRNTRRKAVTIKKSRKRTSLDEFAMVNNLRPEVKAGFKAWLKGEEFHFDSEWNSLYQEYSNR